MAFNKDELNARFTELSNLINTGKDTLDESTLSFLMRERTSLQKLMAMEDSNYESLYTSEQADVVMLGENLTAMDAVASVSANQALEDAKQMTERQNDCVNAIKTLTSMENPNEEMLNDLNAEANLLIAEHPIRYAIQCLKDIICEISSAKESLYNSGIEYRNYKKQACDAVFKMGNSAYQGVVAPIRTTTVDMIENVAREASSHWQKVCEKFHEVKETVCERLEAVKKVISKPIHAIQLKVADSYVRIHNISLAFRMYCLGQSAKLAYSIAEKITLKEISYDKAARKLAAAEKQIKTEIDGLLGTESYQAKEYTPNPAIQAQIDALRQLFPDDTITKLLIATKEKILADEKKAWDKQEIRIAKTDAKLKEKLIQKEVKELNQIEKLYDRATDHFDRLYSLFSKVKILTVKAQNRVASFAQENPKWKVVDTGNKVSIDKGQNQMKESDSIELD